MFLLFKTRAPRRWLLLILAWTLAAGSALAQGSGAREWRTPPPGDVQRGAALYQARCSACHAVDSNKIGPADQAFRRTLLRRFFRKASSRPSAM